MRLASCFAASRSGLVAATARAYSRTSAVTFEIRLGPPTIQKKIDTMISRLIAIVTMMVTSLTNTDRRMRVTGYGTKAISGIVVLSADEAVAGAAHGPDQRRPPRIVAQLLTQAADRDVDRSVVRLPVEAARLVHQAIARKD